MIYPPVKKTILGMQPLNVVNAALDAEEKNKQFETKYLVCPKRCKSRFCDNCAPIDGKRLRSRLIAATEKFESVMMITLTVDPTLFSSPLQAWDHVRTKSLIARLMKRLNQRGFTNSKHYFYVVEWQKNGMAHYHLLLDSKFVPFDLLCEIWNRNRPVSAGPVEGDRPGFGSVLISKTKGKSGFKNSFHAACYAAKYVTKPPYHGYPRWVMEYTGRIKRYGVSHRFWKDLLGEKTEKEVEENAEKITEENENEELETAEPELEKVPPKPIVQRIKRCCDRIDILVQIIEKQDNEEDKVSWKFFSDLKAQIEEVNHLLGRDWNSRECELIDRRLAMSLSRLRPKYTVKEEPRHTSKIQKKIPF